MLIGIGYDLVFQCQERTAMLLALYTHPSHRRHIIGTDCVRSDPALPVEEYIDSFGNRCGRLTAPAGRLHLWSHAIVAVSGLPDDFAPQSIQHPLDELPADTLLYLLASRYCESDRLLQTAWQLFGNTTPGGRGSRPSATGCIITSPSAIGLPATTGPPGTCSTNAAVSAATSPIWPSPSAAP